MGEILNAGVLLVEKSLFLSQMVIDDLILDSKLTKSFAYGKINKLGCGLNTMRQLTGERMSEAEMLFKNEELRILAYSFFISPLMVPFLLKYEAKT
jgi:hypothetical protein